MYNFVKIDRAIFNDVIVSINDKRVLSGKSGCICLGCGNPLIARKGKVVVWHFAHDPSSIDMETLSLSCGYVKSLEKKEAVSKKKNSGVIFEKKKTLPKFHAKPTSKKLPPLPMECVRCTFQFVSDIRCCPQCGDHLLTRYLVDATRY
ncbi:competence protein CoiA family protein [Xenorhabdus sp. KJ12.1]|uniref:competence protein CoiA family protein n=1 Tax=Xenorhabdus sp. KJ12.1 TaxID=1851571 RepID=UPI000C0392FF|nr:competence protein CoiA family protein [Xenorhabdus sp. KJ12.1]PHM72247.1 hypothetical protein Xekj_00525 [Xenorhabdus sp. KJ12.1]